MINNDYCILDAEINDCAFFDRNTGQCTKGNDNTCGMLRKTEDGINTGYERRTRWYEKYYKK